MIIKNFNKIQFTKELIKLDFEDTDFIDNYKEIKISDALYIGCCLISKKFMLDVKLPNTNIQISLEIETIKELKTLIKILKRNSK